MTPQERKSYIEALVKPRKEPIWNADFPLYYLAEDLIKCFGKESGPVNLTPDFQRGHVWTQVQQEKFVEAVVRRAVPKFLMTMQFNCPTWRNPNPTTDLPNEVQCIDGLQRITALTRFMLGKIKAFGLFYHELENTSVSISRLNCTVSFCMHEFSTRKELLEYYIDLNEGSTPHTPEELSRIRRMLHE